MRNTVTRSLSIRAGVAEVLIALLAALPLFAQQPSEAPSQPVAPPASQQPQPATAPTAGSSTPSGQAPAVQPGTLAPTVQGLKLVALAGKGEANDLQRHVMAPLVVEVLDQDDRPVEGAEVVFRFPINGASAAFPDGKTSRSVHTNGQGQAAAMNWVANNEVGSFEVHVTATYGNQVGEIDIPMSNANRVVEQNARSTAKRSAWYSPTWVKAAILGGTVAIAAGVFLATRGGGSKSSSSPTTVTITPGSPTIGGPQ